MKIDAIMTPRPACGDPDTDLQEIARMMVECNCGEIPIVENGKPAGVVTDRDIVVRVVAPGLSPTDMTARDCMTVPCAVIPRDAPVEDAVALMEEKQIRRLPVVDANGEICGIVSQADIARNLGKREAGEMVREISEPAGISR